MGLDICSSADGSGGRIVAQNALALCTSADVLGEGAEYSVQNTFCIGVLSLACDQFFPEKYI
jgi:hypothetical protein